MKKKILITLLIILLLLAVTLREKSQAASYSFNFTGPSEASKGQTVTLNITGNGLTGKVLLTASNATLSSSQVWVEKNTVNVTAKITAFPVKITATPSELTDNEYNIVNLSSKTITINEKQTQTGGGSTSGGGSSSGSNNSGSSNSGGTSGSTSGGSTNSGGSSSGSGSSTGGSSTSKPSTNTKPSGGTSQSQSPDQSYVPNQTNIENGDIKSSNNYLQSITLSSGMLLPEFYRETFEYTVENLPEDIMEIEVSAVAEDERASVSGLGKLSLNSGENKINIEVSAENGNVRSYTLTINKKEELQESDLRLRELEISKINRNGEFEKLDLPFDKETFEYDVEVEEDIVDLDVNPTVESEGIIVEVAGDKNLKAGENDVLITLTAQNNEEIQTIYKVRVNKKEAVQTSTEVIKIDETWKIVTIGVLLLVLASEIGIYFILKKKRKIK